MLQLSGALTCPRCQEQFTEVSEFLSHKAECARKAKEHADESAHSDPEDMVVSEEDDYDSESGGKRLERMRRHRQDAANNNSVDETASEEQQVPRLEFPFPVPAAAGHVTLEALQNTKVAVAQFAATAMANSTDSEAAMQELTVLHSALFTLQHQQVLQLQLINQLQQQLSINTSKASSPVSPTLEGDADGDCQPESPPPSEIPAAKDMGTPLAATSLQQINPGNNPSAEHINDAQVPLSLPPQIQVRHHF